MKAYLPHAGILAAASIIESAAGDTILLRDLQQTYRGHRHSIRALSSVESVKTSIPSVPSAAPSIHRSVENVPSSVPTALSESIIDPSGNSLSRSAATASATMSDSSTIPNNTQLEEQKSGIFGMSLFETCAAVITIAMVLGLFGHYGMKLLPYNRLREDNARNDVQSEDSLASSRTHPHTSVSNNVGV